MLASQMVTSGFQIPFVSCTSINWKKFIVFFFLIWLSQSGNVATVAEQQQQQHQHPQHAVANKLLNYKYCRLSDFPTLQGSCRRELPRRCERKICASPEPALTVMQISKKNCMPNVVCVVTAKSNVYNLSRKQATDTCCSSSSSSRSNSRRSRQIFCRFSFLFAAACCCCKIYTRGCRTRKKNIFKKKKTTKKYSITCCCLANLPQQAMEIVDVQKCCCFCCCCCLVNAIN